MTAESAYDRLAPHYREYSKTRAAYIDAVDRLILERAPRRCRLLDVGAGDGVRGMRLGRALDATRIVLCEPSAGMAAMCREQGADEVWQLPAEALPDDGGPFNLIVCLWNVLGHLPDRAARVAALAGVRRLLARDGVLFLDVNNRHNARAYGRWRVAMRRFVDHVVPDESRGDASFEWRVGGTRVAATGHLFTLRELEDILLSAGLEIVHRMAVDYRAGVVSDDLRHGQLLVGARACPGGGQ